MGLCCLSDRPRSEEAVQSRSEPTKLSGARMPEQRRAGQLVNNKIKPQNQLCLATWVTYTCVALLVDWSLLGTFRVRTYPSGKALVHWYICRSHPTEWLYRCAQSFGFFFRNAEFSFSKLQLEGGMWLSSTHIMQMTWKQNKESHKAITRRKFRYSRN